MTQRPACYTSFVATFCSIGSGSIQDIKHDSGRKKNTGHWPTSPGLTTSPHLSCEFHTNRWLSRHTSPRPDTWHQAALLFSFPLLNVPPFSCAICAIVLSYILSLLLAPLWKLSTYYAPSYWSGNVCLQHFFHFQERLSVTKACVPVTFVPAGSAHLADPACPLWPANSQAVLRHSPPVP
jgi:hypothetical protein